MRSDFDVRQLAVDRRQPPAPQLSPPRHLVARYIVPAAVLIGFGLLLAWTARSQWMRSKPVKVVPVVLARADVRSAGTPLFQAAGWIEPRPTPVIVAALAPGVIEDLLVVEGQEVQAGEPVARLIKVDAELALRQAEAELQLRHAERTSARAELTAARKRLEEPVHLEAVLAEAESQLAEIQTELERLPLELRAAQARLELANQHLEGKQSAGDAVSERVVQEYTAQRDSAAAAVEEHLARKPLLERRIEAIRRKRKALARQLELKIEETRQAAEAEAKSRMAETRLREAQVGLEAAQLQLERTTVKAPVSGRVLELVAPPGARVMGMAPHSMYDASSVLTLYDPQKLQVRADVRLEDVPLVEPGQPVRIETASADEPIDGEVLFCTSRANIQKNTLEVKVAIHSPPPTIRPEMLVQVTFLAPEAPSADLEDSRRPERLLIPRSLVEDKDGGRFVWVADPAGTARLQAIELGYGTQGDLVEVADGLTATDRLISSGRDGLGDGQRIHIEGEDTSIGMRSVD
jgi:RND family efflux transporter MFP subunit